MDTSLLLKLEDLVSYLNDCVRQEPAAMHTLFGFKTACGEALDAYTTKHENIHLVGFLGLINGFLSKQGKDRLVAVYEETLYRRLSCFVKEERETKY